MALQEIKPIENKHFNYESIVFSIILASLMFVMGFLISYTVSYSQYKDLKLDQDNMKYDLLSFQVENQLLGDSCELLNPYRFASEMDDMGLKISILEKSFGKQDSKVIEKKEIYSILEAQHFLYIKDINTKCNKNINTLLFFYSNNENEATDGELYGTIISALKSNNNDLMVYSFDYWLDTPIVNLMKTKYNVTIPNTIIINEKTKLTNIKNIKDIQIYLK
ncbi:MAG: hypothetical protein WC781_02070 [Candidatus Pacearchaeota archaeon]|jgi:hypothetical protein